MLGSTQNGTRCPGPVDLIFVMDESASMANKNFDLSKSFLSRLVEGMDVDSNRTRVGVVCFSTHVDVAEAFNLNAYSSVASVQSAISRLTYSRGQTHTAAALRYVREKMLTPAAGDRPDVPNVVIVMTDGRSNINRHVTKVCTRAETLRRKTLLLGFNNL